MGGNKEKKMEWAKITELSEELTEMLGKEIVSYLHAIRKLNPENANDEQITAIPILAAKNLLIASVVSYVFSGGEDEDSMLKDIFDAAQERINEARKIKSAGTEEAIFKFIKQRAKEF